MKPKCNLIPRKEAVASLSRLAAVLLALVASVGARAQGTMTFDNPWATGGIGYYSLYYDTSGMSFEIGYRTPPYDDPARVGVGFVGHPNNGTPHAEFVNMVGSPQFIVFALTNAASFGHYFTNGAPFGLTSVDLADPVAPSLTPVSITFNGFKVNGSMVSQTFTTPGGGATAFQTYSFDSDFASDVVRLEVPSPAWAMDNIGFTVPEPSALSLFGLGAVGLVRRHFGRRARL